MSKMAFAAQWSETIMKRSDEEYFIELKRREKQVIFDAFVEAAGEVYFSEDNHGMFTAHIRTGEKDVHIAFQSYGRIPTVQDVRDHIIDIVLDYELSDGETDVESFGTLSKYSYSYGFNGWTIVPSQNGQYTVIHPVHDGSNWEYFNSRKEAEEYANPERFANWDRELR